jgi:hypothetical protein
MVTLWWNGDRLYSARRETPLRSERRSLWLALSMAWELGYTIAIPIVVFTLLGRWLDKRFDSYPVLFLSGVLFSIILSTIGVYFKAMRILRETEGAPPVDKAPDSDGPTRSE